MRSVAEILWAERTRAELERWSQRNTVVIVPIGSIEQHGLHLPVDTDCRSAEHVARQAACLVEDTPILVTPTLPLGISPHHMMFPGTISLRVSTLVAMLRDICESISAHGFERILILSGHGGNRDTIGAAALEMRHQLHRLIWARCWFDLIPKEMDALREGPGGEVGHSGEIETSMMLALAPHLVRREHLHIVNGITDDPARGTPAKGEALMRAAIEATARLARTMAAMPGREISDIITLPG
jgi:creatinine amidohydrolase